MSPELSFSPISERLKDIKYISEAADNVKRDTDAIIRYLKYELEKVTIENYNNGWPTGYDDNYARITIMSSPIHINDGVLQDPDHSSYFFFRTKNTHRAYFWYIIQEFKRVGFSVCLESPSYTYSSETLNIEDRTIEYTEGVQYYVDLVISYSHTP